jgi:anti-sigma factor RsiW
MNCNDVWESLLGYQQGRLPTTAQGEVCAHLEGCPDCAHVGAVEQELTSVLEHRLPQYPASFALKRQIAAQWPVWAPRRSRWSWWRLPSLVPASALAAVVLIAVPVLYYERAASREPHATAGLVGEAVNDHLRMLARQHPLEIESGGLHQVKPWFEGRLDFAPGVSFEGDTDFPLKGGAVGYFLDRKAAVFVYAHRLHPISLFVFRADGLRWPAPDGTASRTEERGFNVVMWHRAELGYALVSDVDRRDLASLVEKLQSMP